MSCRAMIARRLSLILTCLLLPALTASQDRSAAGPPPLSAEALQAVEAHLEMADEQLAAQAAHLDLLAEELRLAQISLNSITGEFSSDDLLGVIFSSFCIGK